MTREEITVENYRPLTLDDFKRKGILRFHRKTMGFEDFTEFKYENGDIYQREYSSDKRKTAGNKYTWETLGWSQWKPYGLNNSWSDIHHPVSEKIAEIDYVYVKTQLFEVINKRGWHTEICWLGESSEMKGFEIRAPRKRAAPKKRTPAVKVNVRKMF